MSKLYFNCESSDDCCDASYDSISPTTDNNHGDVELMTSSALVTDVRAIDIATTMLPSNNGRNHNNCLLYTSPSPRDATLSRMPSSA